MTRVRLNFRSLTLFEDEDAGYVHMAMYATIADGDGIQIASFRWNNAGGEVDEVATYSLANDPGNPNVVDLDLNGFATIRVSAFTHDDNAWPSSSDFENNLGSASASFDANVPGSLGTITVGPTRTDNDNTGYEVVVDASVIQPPVAADVRLRFDNLVLYEDEEWGSAHMAIYVRAKGPGIDQEIFRWNNANGEVDEVNTYGLDNGGVPTTVTLSLTGPTLIAVEGWTHDDDVWPDRDNFENNLGKAAILVDPGDPTTLGNTKIGPTLTDADDTGYELNLAIDKLPAPGTGPALAIIGVEVTQAIQHFETSLGEDNSVPLVSNRVALVRAYLDSGIGGTSGGTVDNVSGTLRVTNASGTTTLAPVSPMTARPIAQVNRADITHTLNFLVPANLTNGEVNLTVQAAVAGSTSDPSAVDVVFRPTNPIDILMVRIGSGPFSPPTQDFFISAVNRLPLVYPLATDSAQSIRYWISPGSETITNTHDLSNDDGMDDLLDDIDDIQDEFASRFKAYGMINDSVSMARFGMSDDCSALGWSALLESIAHELGHLYGLAHAPCGGPADPDDDFVPSNGMLGEVGVEPISQTVFDTNVSDFMSYCGAAVIPPTLASWASENQWISAYHWNKLFSTFRG